HNLDCQALLAKLAAEITAYGALILSDYGKGTLDTVQQMIQIARQANVPVLIDPKGTDFERYRGATLLTPNMSEFEAVAGHCRDEDEIVTKGL
ncbi:PfkB family carbohydrate kinase, partial [Glaesserella parasuis]|nr:PfkB family carbohydrate kinase [Glaesserella parasuis]